MLGLHLQVLFLLAVVYGQDCPTAPMRGLGGGLSRNAIVIGQDEWIANSARVEVVPGERKVSGVQLSVVRGKYGGASPIRKRETWFFPWSAVEELVVGFGSGGVKLQ